MTFAARLAGPGGDGGSSSGADLGRAEGERPVQPGRAGVLLAPHRAAFVILPAYGMAESLYGISPSHGAWPLLHSSVPGLLRARSLSS